MRKYWKSTLVIVLILIAAGVGLTFGISSYVQSQVLIPQTITKKVGFLLFVPTGVSGVRFDKSSTKLDSSAGVVSFYVYSQGTRIAFAEQAEPQSFTDVPQVYDQLLNKLREYQDITTEFGTVTLTKPVELNGGQSAVVDSKGTLVIATPTKNLSVNQWQNVFNNMQLAS